MFEIPVCVNVYAFESTCISCAFPLALSLVFVFICPMRMCLFLFDFIMSYFIYYFLYACLFSMEMWKGYESGWRRTWRSRGLF